MSFFYRNIEGATVKINSENRLLTAIEAAEFLGVKPQTLAVWRCNQRYDLPFVKVGNAVKYRMSDLEAWLESRTIGKLTN